MTHTWTHDDEALADDGEGIRYRVHGPATNKTPMLLYPGLVSSMAHWPFFVEHFAQQRKVVSWDYRGHGGGPVPRNPDSITVERFADDGAAVLAQTTAQTGGGPAIVVGLSFGVQVALEHVRRHPKDVRALILLCGTDGHPLDRLSEAAWLRQAASALMRGFSRSGALGRLLLGLARAPGMRQLAYLSGGARRGQCPPDALDAIFAHTASLDPIVAGRIVASYFQHSAREVLPTVHVPTLIFAGDRDQLTPVSSSERMRDRIAGARLEVFPGHSHVLQLEKPTEVHAKIDDFLSVVGL